MKLLTKINNLLQLKVLQHLIVEVHYFLIFYQLSKKSRTSNSLNELHYYIQRVVTPEIDQDSGFENFDILAWWKSQASTYHVLSIMARDVLTLPAFIVPSKSAFSTGDRVLTDTRNHLASDAIEMTIYRNDWLDAEKRSQNKTIDDLIKESPDDSQSVSYTHLTLPTIYSV